MKINSFKGITKDPRAMFNQKIGGKEWMTWWIICETKEESY